MSTAPGLGRHASNVGSVPLSRRIAVAVIAFFVFFAIAEILLRLFWENPYHSDHVSLVVELTVPPKNINVTIDRSAINPAVPKVVFRTDSRGYIQPAARFDEPDYSVAFLGGSTTECAFVQEHLRFPAQVSFLLEKKGVKLNALNLGVSGNDTHQSLNNLLNYVVNDRPTAVVLMEAANDIGHLRTPVGYQRAMGNSPTLTGLARLLFQKASAYSAILGMVRNAKVLLGNKAALDRARKGGDDLRLDDKTSRIAVEQHTARLRAFVNTARAFGIIPVLMTQPSANYRNALTPEWINQSDQALFNQAIRDTAAAEKVELIDLVRYLDEREKAQGKFAEPVFYDAIHVTDYGATLYAEHIASRLAEILGRRSALSPSASDIANGRELRAGAGTPASANALPR
ncbi:MAG TPA: SGNH/GDSL hydrolase family protein [Burkholderiales bacterium]|nr:SGNH/GDSL hydrolase family protein [Burkholderiales bacterium]